MDDVLLRIESLSASYGGPDVIADIGFSMAEGEILCLVGESGSGKSSLIKAIHGFGGLNVTKGRVFFQGRDITDLSGAERRTLMGRGMALIPQDPAASFNPIRKYRAQFREALSAHGMGFDEEGISDILSDIGLSDGKAVLKSRPYELSGGMNQRIAIAAAMMFKPRLLLCDEATSALDVTTAGKVVRELMEARDRAGTAILMVTHHLGIAKLMADNIGIMKDGRMVEYGKRDKIFECPEHEYTRRLMRDVPKLKR